jgi:hypothetical protein
LSPKKNLAKMSGSVDLSETHKNCVEFSSYLVCAYKEIYSVRFVCHAEKWFIIQSHSFSLSESEQVTCLAAAASVSSRAPPFCTLRQRVILTYKCVF